MTVAEYNKMQEAAGTPKVWVVDSAWGSGCLVNSQLFISKEEAKAAFDKLTGAAYRDMYRTWDIWGFTERMVGHA